MAQSQPSLPGGTAHSKVRTGQPNQAAVSSSVRTSTSTAPAAIAIRRSSGRRERVQVDRPPPAPRPARTRPAPAAAGATPAARAAGSARVVAHQVSRDSLRATTSPYRVGSPAKTNRPPGLQHPQRLPQRQLDVRDVVQHRVPDDEVEAAVRRTGSSRRRRPCPSTSSPSARALRSATSTMPGLMSVTEPRPATPACIRLSRKKPVPQPISSARRYGQPRSPAIGREPVPGVADAALVVRDRPLLVVRAGLPVVVEHVGALGVGARRLHLRAGGARVRSSAGPAGASAGRPGLLAPRSRCEPSRSLRARSSDSLTGRRTSPCRARSRRTSACRSPGPRWRTGRRTAGSPAAARWPGRCPGRRRWPPSPRAAPAPGPLT